MVYYVCYGAVSVCLSQVGVLLKRAVCKIWWKCATNYWRTRSQCSNRNRKWNLHISRIRFIFPVLFTTEYKVSVA